MTTLLVRNPELSNDPDGYHLLTFEVSLDGTNWQFASLNGEPKPTLAHNGITWLGLADLPKLRVVQARDRWVSELEGCTTSPEVFELQCFLGAYCNQSAVRLPDGPINRTLPIFRELAARGKQLLERSGSHSALKLDLLEEVTS
jgi:hypothetical protein